MDTFESDRDFQVWSYGVGHRQLLIRSNKSDLLKTRINVHFKDVSFMLLDTRLHGLKIAIATHIDGALEKMISLNLKNGHVFQLESAGKVNYVQAAAFAFSEDEKNYYDD